MSAVRTVIDELVTQGATSPARLGAAFGEIMDGQSTPVLSAGLLIALRMKGESVDEIVAVAQTLRERAMTARVEDARTIDTCGTGGSGLDTFNISTTAAFVVAGAGVSVAKHGNRAATSRSGSFDLLESLGIAIDLPIEVSARVLNEIGIGTFFARTAHPAFRHVAPVRAELGVRTLLNCLGPLLSPVGATYQVVGVYSQELVETLAEALGRLGAVRAMVVHGADGMDELTTTGPSTVALLAGGRVEKSTLNPVALGLERATPESLRGGSPEQNAETTRAILAGEAGPRRDIVLLNAAAALYVAEAAPSMEAGLELAAASIDEGRAAGKLEALRVATQKAARLGADE